MLLSANIIVHWGEILRTLGIMVLIAFVFGVAYAIKYVKCARAFSNRDYDYVLQCESLLRRFRKKSIQHERVQYMLAVAYFMRNDDESFLRHMSAVTAEEAMWAKNYWLSVYAVMQEDFEKYDLLQKELRQKAKDARQTELYDILTLAYKHKKEGYILSDEDREKVANCNYDRIKQIFA